MLKHYYHHPIVGGYYYPRADWDKAIIHSDLAAIKAADLSMIWLFYDPLYDADDPDSLRWILDRAYALGLEIVPVLGQFLQLDAHPEVKIINGDGTTSDNPRYWNMGCMRHPTVIDIASERAARFFRDFSDHPALYRLDGKAVMSVAHETYYRNSVPEFGGGPMMPSCYCEHCLAAFADYLNVRGLDPTSAAPRDASDPVLWQHWLDCHAEAIPQFLTRVITAVNDVTPIWATHECNDFYPASWQSVYTGNDFWRMGATLDFGHEDMYPLEFVTQYVCYVYNYAKDIMRSAVNFEKLITANGQAFNSWLGYKIPDNSMSEQVYSALAHGALGMVWWGQWPTTDPDTRYELLRQTAAPNREFTALVEKLQGFELTRARIAMIYSWTTMSQMLDDDHTYDTLLTYMLLTQLGYPVDILSEAQIAGGMLQGRDYAAVFALSCSALPTEVHQAVQKFVAAGGLLIADHAQSANEAFQTLYPDWRTDAASQPRAYTLPDAVPAWVHHRAAPLNPPQGAEILARFEDDSPAAIRVKQGDGHVLMLGSTLGWDYSNFPGYYDLAAMFPFHIWQDPALRTWIGDLLQNAGIHPPVTSSHPDVEVALWRKPDDSAAMLFVINHLTEAAQTAVQLTDGQPITAAHDAITGENQPVTGQTLHITLEPMQGRAVYLVRQQ